MNLVTEAREKDLWIYVKNTKEWYGPDDFPAGIDPANCELRHPQEGIDAALTLMDRSVNEVVQKATRIIKYHSK